MRYSLFYIIIFSFVIGQLFACKANHVNINQSATQTLIYDMFNPDSCNTDSRGKIIDVLLEYPVIGLDSTILLKWLGEPINRRFKKDKKIIFIYTCYNSYENNTCGLGDLICFEFNKKGKLSLTYLKFITDVDDVNVVYFWHSKKVPPYSTEGDNETSFFEIF